MIILRIFLTLVGLAVYLLLMGLLGAGLFYLANWSKGRVQTRSNRHGTMPAQGKLKVDAKED